jgi:kinetochore protein NDC80
MADHNRRSTMQPALDPYGNARSGIPQPVVPSTIKKSQNLRMSMAGPAIRGPTNNPTGPPSNPRQSMLRSQNVNPLLASTTKQQNYGRTPLSKWVDGIFVMYLRSFNIPSISSTRRASVWVSGVQSSALPNLQQQPLRDTRPLRERPFQARMRQDILNLLTSTSYDIDMKVLVNITGKDFRTIVLHLVYLIDPGYLFSEKARFEDEFVITLKAMRYPFAGSIDTKWLAAPASMHSWPFLLGALHWLCELVRVSDPVVFIVPA